MRTYKNGIAIRNKDGTWQCKYTLDFLTEVKDENGNLHFECSNPVHLVCPGCPFNPKRKKKDKPDGNTETDK